MPLLNIKENIGGNAIAPFTADSGLISGIAEGGLPQPNNLGSLTNPAPPDVYTSIKYSVNPSPIQKTGFTPNSTVKLRLHIFSNNDGHYLQRITDNIGTGVLNFDYQGRQVGAQNSSAVAAIYELNLLADNSGAINATLERVGGYSVWIADGIELLEQGTATPTPTTYLVDRADLTENANNVLDANPFSRFTFTTGETNFTLGIYSTLFSSAAIVSNLLVKVNGAFHSLVGATAQGDSAVNITLPAGQKTVEITNGVQDRPNPNAAPLGTWLKSVGHNGDFTIVQPTNSGKRTLLITDSIGGGAAVGNGENLKTGYVARLRNSRTESIMVYGWGFYALSRLVIADIVAAAQIYSAERFICTLGVNDFNLDLVGAVAYADKAAQLADAIHAALPLITIDFVTPTLLANESPKSFEAFSVYRAKLYDVMRSRSFVKMIDGAVMQNSTLNTTLTDGVHPSAQGHIDLYNAFNVVFDEKMVEIGIGDSTQEGRKTATPSSSLEAVPHLYRNLIGASLANSYKEAFNGLVTPEGQYLPTNGDFSTTKKIDIINYGIGNQTITQAIAAFNTQVLSRNRLYAKTWVNLICIINETQFHTAAEIYQYLKDYAALCRINNVRLRLATCAAVTNATFGAIANSVNAMLRADHSFVDQFVDIAALPEAQDAANSAYFETDGVHWKTALNQIVANEFFAVRQGAKSGGGGSSPIFTDNFNRADGAIGDNWQAIVSGGFSVPTGNIVSNQLQMTGGNAFHGYARPDLIAEGSSEIELAAAAGNGLAPVVRLQTNGDCYLAYAALGSAAYTRIYKSSGGSATPVSSTFNYALQIGDKLKLKVQGNVIIFSYIRGGVETEIGRYTDAANPILTAGKFGFVSDAASVTLDNFKLINNDVAAPPTNTAPTVNAGSDQTITLPAAATLNGAASDDGLPSGSTLAKTWSKVSGPGTVGFSNPNALNTTATFSTAGTYVLRLTVTDGALTSSDDITITVNSSGPPANTKRMRVSCNPASGATVYRFKRDTVAAMNSVNLQTFNSATPVYRDETGVFGTTYYWTVEAGNAYGYSAPFAPSVQILQNNG